MEPREHQVAGAKWALDTVRKYGLAYLHWSERTGKTLTALLAVENSTAQSCLIITKKRAIEGWEDTLTNWSHKTKFVVTNYESIHKITEDFDFILLDEAHHAIASIGKPSKTWKAVYKHTRNKAIIYMSATGYAESVGQLYHQFKLSAWTPWKRFKNFYDFHREYGIPKVVYTSYGVQQDYSVFRVDDVLDTCSRLFNFKTRAEVGHTKEPVIKLIHIPLHEDTKALIKEWTENRVLSIGGHDIMGDSDSKMRVVHYQLEGGMLKC